MTVELSNPQRDCVRHPSLSAVSRGGTCPILVVSAYVYGAQARRELGSSVCYVLLVRSRGKAGDRCAKS